jgi:hypothetical protein
MNPTEMIRGQWYRISITDDDNTWWIIFDEIHDDKVHDLGSVVKFYGHNDTGNTYSSGVFTLTHRIKEVYETTPGERVWLDGCLQNRKYTPFKPNFSPVNDEYEPY